MINCVAKAACFYKGKRYRKGDKVNFDGAAKDLPDYLEKAEVKKEAKPTK